MFKYSKKGNLVHPDPVYVQYYLDANNVSKFLNALGISFDSDIKKKPIDKLGENFDPTLFE